MDRLVSVDTKELLLHHPHPRKQQGAKPPSSSGTSHPQRRRRCCSAAFRVTNLMHTMTVAVHVSTRTTTRPCSFSFSPSFPLALLPPLSSASFSLHYLTGTADGEDNADHDDAGSSCLPLASPPDTVVVRSAMLPTGKADTANLLGLFSGPAAAHIFTDARIPIYFVGRGALLCLSSRFSASSSGVSLTLDTAFLLSKAACACSPPELSSFLLHFAAAGNPHFVSALLDAGADPNHRDGAGKSSLSLAVDAGCPETVQVLLDAGALVDPALDRLIMHEAAAKNGADLMRVVVESAAAAEWWADSTDSAGRTPLHVAAAHGHLEATRFCLSSSSSSSGGCDPDRADANGWTPLHHAATGGSLEVTRLLLGRCSYATKYALTSDSRKTPFDLAVDAAGAHEVDARPLLALLRLDDQLHRAAAVGDAGGVRSCLARGATVDCRDQNGWTPLHRAAFKGRTEVAEILIERGAEVDATDGAGWTPLRCAVEAGRDVVALLLIARGAKRAGLKGLAAAEDFLAKSDAILVPGPGKSPDPLAGRCLPAHIPVPVSDSKSNHP